MQYRFSTHAVGVISSLSSGCPLGGREGFTLPKTPSSKKPHGTLPKLFVDESVSSNSFQIHQGDARDAARFVDEASLDCIVTSPPYWRKRDYGHPLQLGQEATPQEFARALADILDAWRPLLKPTASVFLNLGDSIRDGKMAGVTTLFELEAVSRGWNLVSRIVWAKTSGLPDPHNRLPNRNELIFHFAPATPFVDLFAYSQEFEKSQGDVWPITLKPTKGAHLAPFPEELARRAILLSCPERVCCGCARPVKRRLERGFHLDPNRIQTRRALELWEQHNLDERHLGAIRATGLCDAGKSMHWQTGANRNRPEIIELASEAKRALGGYFREFVGGKLEQTGWEPCVCGDEKWTSGLVFDPFAGTGTTLRAAESLRRRSVGMDLMALK